MQEDDLLAWIAREGEPPVPVKATLSGVLRGLIHDNYPVRQGMKIADIDPRAEAVSHCFTISDKSRALGNATLSALLYLLSRRPDAFGRWSSPVAHQFPEPSAAALPNGEDVPSAR